MTNQKTNLTNIGSLTLIQLLLSIGVMFHHSMKLGSNVEDLPGLLLFFGKLGDNLGDLCVNAFLVLSGYMLCRSVASEIGGLRACSRYAVKRLTKIFPGIFFVTLLAVFVVGPVFTIMGRVSHYFGNSGTWVYLQHLLLFVRAPVNLPGVFDSNIYPRVVNGVLWMIPWLMWCYVLFGVALLFKMHRNRMFVGALLVLSLYGLTLSRDIPADAMFCGLWAHDGLRLVAYFVTGWAICLWSDNLRFDVRIALGLLAMLPLWYRTAAHDLAGCLIVGYVLCVFCFHSRDLAFARKVPRIHWEVFLLGFVVQQSVTALHGGSMNHWLNFVESLIITIPMAFALHAIITPSSAWCRNKLLALLDKLEQQQSV